MWSNASGNKTERCRKEIRERVRALLKRTNSEEINKINVWKKK